MIKVQSRCPRCNAIVDGLRIVEHLQRDCPAVYDWWALPHEIVAQQTRNASLLEGLIVTPVARIETNSEVKL